MNSEKQLNFIKEIHDLNPNYKGFIDIIASTQKNLSLICFLGAGTSISQGYKNWDGYVQDLIQYWKSHLQDLINEKTLYQAVQATDIKSLDWLNEKSGFSNKRKVDFVHYIIKKYCKPQKKDGNFWKNMYFEHVNDFEKSYFLKISPINSNNEIIDQLLNLSALFITANYDDQIEKSFRKFFHSEPNTLNDINELENNKLTDKSILHLHGTPKYKGVMLVSSSASYNKLYLENNNNYKEKLIDQIKQQGSTVLLYVGSSLQEEEILNFFNFDQPKLQKFALMKLDMETDQANLVRDYYKAEKNIDIIWYGKRYSDLPKFLKLLNQDVRNYLEEKSTFISAEMILDDLKNAHYLKLDKHVTKAIKNNEEILDSCFKNNLDEKSIEILVNNKLFVNKLLQGYRFSFFFKEVNKYYSTLSNSVIEEIIEIIKKMPGVRGEYNSVHILYKYSKKLRYKSKFDFLFKYTSKFLFRTYNPFQLNNIMEKNMWLLSNLSKKNEYYSLKEILSNTENKSIVFKLSSNELRKLLDILNENKFIQDAGFKEILDDERCYTVYFLIKEDRLSCAKSFPNYFYKNKLMQRLLINLKLKNELPPTIDLKKLVKNIDYKDRLLGKETNNFVEKYSKEHYIKSNFYIDGWRFTEINGASKPFFKVFPLDSESSVNCLVSNLKEILDKRPTFDGQDMNGQQKALIKVLNNKNEWNNFYYNNVLFLSKLISDIDLFKTYLGVINAMIISGLKFEYIKEDFLEKYFKKISDDRYYATIFNYSNIEVLDFIISKGKSNQKHLLYDCLFKKVNTSKLSFTSNTIQSENNKKWILLNSFVNSEAYGYYYLVKKIIDQDYSIFVKKYKDQFIKGINSLHKQEREYIKGSFYDYFKKDRDLHSDNAFIGFSHSYSIETESAKFFYPQVIDLLNSDFNEKFCNNNIVFVLMYIINPDKAMLHNPIPNQDYKKVILLRMLNVYLSKKFNKNCYVTEWCTWALKNLSGSAQLILDQIIQNIDNVAKSDKLFNVLTTNLYNIGKYSLLLNQIFFNKSNNYSKESFELLINVIQSLSEKNLLKIDYMLTVTVGDILHQISKRQYFDLIPRLLSVSKNFLLPSDQKKLEKYFSGNN